MTGRDVDPSDAEQRDESTLARLRTMFALTLIISALGAFFLMWGSEFAVVVFGQPNTPQWGFAYPKKVPANDAAERVGDYVQVCGTVHQEIYDPDSRLVFLNFGEEYPSQRFAFWGDPYLVKGTVNPTEKNLEGKFVCGRGSVELFRGGPQIHIEQGDLRRDFRFTPLSLAALVGGSLFLAYLRTFADQSKTSS